MKNAVRIPISASALLLLGLSFTISLELATTAVLAAPARGAGFFQSPGQSSGFTGAWCAQGDPAKHCSISSNGAFLSLTNENGDTSVGNVQGNNSISAPGWQFVTGTLSPNGSQINWSNGTYWARCDQGGGGGGGGRGRHLNLTGTWYANGNRSQSCSIRQRGRRLQLSNESGQNASGQLDGKRQLTTTWDGATIQGTISRDGNRIDWDNGTYWIRFRLLGSGF